MATKHDPRAVKLAYTLGSDSRAWHRVTKEGLPRWATAGVVAVALVTSGSAVGVYFASKSWVATGVFAGVGVLICMGIVNAAQLIKPNDRTDITNHSGRTIDR